MTHSIEVKNDDALSFPCDVLILKYAQALYGVDKAVTAILSKDKPSIHARLPKIGDYTIFEANGAIPAKRVMFIGTKPLREFQYEDIRSFARQGLEVCASKINEAEVIGLTLHGATLGWMRKKLCMQK